MAITHSITIRNGLCNYVVDAIDGGTGAGTLEFQTSGNVEVATLTFTDPAFDDAGSAGGNADGVATANAITSDTSATGGTIAKFVVKESGGNTIFSGSVTASGGGGDITTSGSLTIGAGDTVALSSFTYTAPL